MVQKAVRRRLLCSIVIPAALLLAACHKSAAPAAPAAAAPPSRPPATSAPRADTTPTAVAAGTRAAAVLSAPPSGSAAAVPAPSAAGKEKAASPVAIAQPMAIPVPGPPAPGSSAASSLASAATLLALGRGNAGILPEDFKIGPLGNGSSGTPDKDAAYAAASGFLARLVAGSVDREAITPEARESLSDMIAYGLQKGYAPTSFRLGVPKGETSGELAANVRLFDADSSSEGEIYLALASGRWLVADMQVNLADLAVPSAAPKQRFFPSPYRWLLEE